MIHPTTHAGIKPPPFDGCERTARKIGKRFIVIERRRTPENKFEFVREERTYSRDELTANFPDVVLE